MLPKITVNFFLVFSLSSPVACFSLSYFILFSTLPLLFIHLSISYAHFIPGSTAGGWRWDFSRHRMSVELLPDQVASTQAGFPVDIQFSAQCLIWLIVIVERVEFLLLPVSHIFDSKKWEWQTGILLTAAALGGDSIISDVLMSPGIK